MSGCSAPRPEREFLAQFGDGIRLIGYYMDSPRPAGEFAVLTLYWAVTAKPKADYKVFVHVLTKERTVLAQHDAYPVDGTRPTSKWEPAAIVKDTHFIELEPDLPPGSYDVEIGLYRGDTGQRLPLRDSLPSISPDALLLPEPAQVTPQEPRRNWWSHGRLW